MTAKIIFPLALLLLVLLNSCRSTNNLPTRSSPQYNEIVRTFFIGLAALQVGHDVQADAKLQQFTQLAPASQPAGPTGACSHCANETTTPPPSDSTKPAISRP